MQRNCLFNIVTLPLFISIIFLGLAINVSAALDPPHTGTVGCLSCHQMTSTYPKLLPPLNHTPLPGDIDDTVANGACWSCHTSTGGAEDPPYVLTHSSLTTDNGYGNWTVECWVCHNQHMQEQNLYNGSTYGKYIRRAINLANITGLARTGTKTVRFTGPTGANSFADGDPAAINGICEVCHIQTSQWRSDGTLAGVGLHSGLQGKNCIGCHHHDKGFKAECDVCHGYPPVVNTPQTDDGLVVSPSATGSGTAGWHAVHSTSKRVYLFPCATCHFNGMPDTPISGDNRIQIGFSGKALLSGDATGTRYQGQTLTPAYSYEATNGTVVSVDESTTCGNIYCHSIGQKADGQPLTLDTADYTSPKWNETVISVPMCAYCHLGSPPSGSHAKHLETLHCNKCHYSYLGGSQCGYCHASHPPPGEPIMKVTTTLHVNREVNVGILSQYGGTYNGTPAPGDGFSTCSSTYCHSNGTSVATGSIPANTSAAWGSGPISCTSCHAYGPDYGNGFPKANSHQVAAHAATTCNSCHNTTTTDGTTIANKAIHVNSAYNVDAGGGATFTYTFAATGGTCASVSCHTGNATRIWGSQQ